MLNIDIPSRKPLQAAFLVADYNGTLACDGRILDGVTPLLHAVSALVQIHVVTADTHGSASRQLHGLPVTVTLLSAEEQARQKADYVRGLGADRTIAIGNGRNDLEMLKAAALGICLVQSEGCCVHTLLAADVVCGSAEDALNLLLKPKRLIATLRS